MFTNVRGTYEFATSGLQMGVSRIQPPGAPPYDVVTPIPSEIMFKQGLAPEAIVGVLRQLSNIEGEGGIAPKDFVRNRVFADFLHRVVADHAPKLIEYQAQAKKQHEGWVYVIDGRTPAPKGLIPARDILGAFAVRDGVITPDSYVRNDQYFLYTQDGFFQLHVVLKSKLMEELLRHIFNRRAGHERIIDHLH